MNVHMRPLPLAHGRKLVKSQVSMFRRVAFVSVSVCSLILAYKLGKAQHRTDTWGTSPPSHHLLALKEGQTIVGVSETTSATRFYIGSDVVDSENEA
jgi:hypothetical protein